MIVTMADNHINLELNTYSRGECQYNLFIRYQYIESDAMIFLLCLAKTCENINKKERQIYSVSKEEIGIEEWTVSFV
jgi:hypothetical protein